MICYTVRSAVLLAVGILLQWFWSGVDLTGNQTRDELDPWYITFWSGVDLTGNQTTDEELEELRGFGAVSI